jgi:hypothetical protein
MGKKGKATKKNKSMWHGIPEKGKSPSKKKKGMAY